MLLQGRCEYRKLSIENLIAGEQILGHHQGAQSSGSNSWINEITKSQELHFSHSFVEPL